MTYNTEAEARNAQFSDPAKVLANAARAAHESGVPTCVSQNVLLDLVERMGLDPEEVSDIHLTSEYITWTAKDGRPRFVMVVQA